MSWSVLLRYGYWYTVLAVAYSNKNELVSSSEIRLLIYSPSFAYSNKNEPTSSSEIRLLIYSPCSCIPATRMSRPVLLRYGFWYTVLAVAYSNKNEPTSSSQIRFLIYSPCSCIQQQWADQFFWDTAPNIQSLQLHTASRRSRPVLLSTVPDIQSLQLHTATRMSWSVLLRCGSWYTVLAVAYSNKNKLTSSSEIRFLIYSLCSCIKATTSTSKQCSISTA
jgi:hypothetical protein